MTMRIAGATFLLAASLGEGGCHPGVANRTDADRAGDSLSGIVAVTGTSFEKTVVLRPSPREVRLTGTATDLAALERIGGAEVVVQGSSGPKGFAVDSFRVVRVEGRPVHDGILVADSGGLKLRVGSELLKLGNPPKELRSMTGARVWVGGPLLTGPNTYGVIAPAAK